MSNKFQQYTVYLICKLFYMSRVVSPPIIRSTNNRIYSIWYWSTVVATGWYRGGVETCKLSQFLYFCKRLYMFQAGFPSIIRSSKLHIQRQTFGRPILLPAANLAMLATGRSIGPTNA